LRAEHAERSECPALLTLTGPVRTHARLVAQVHATGAQLARLDLVGDARVAVVAADSADVAVLLVALMAHATAVPLNPLMPEANLRQQLVLLRAKAVVTTERDVTSPVVRASLALGLRVLHLRDDDGGTRGLLDVDARDDDTNNAHDVEAATRGGDDTALVVCTSGTTGHPKVVPLTHNNLLSMLHENCDVLQLTPEDCCVSFMPLFHIHGLGAVLCSVLAGGSVVVLAGGFSAPAFFAALHAHAPTWYTAVPSLHRSIVDQAHAHTAVLHDLRARGGLRLVRSGSAPMPDGLPERLEALFGARYVEACGATEASAYIFSNRPHTRKIGSVGQPMPSNEVLVVDEHGVPVPLGETGELIARGPGIFRGYEGDDATTADAFHGAYFRTGDLGHQDRDGFFFVTGRLKEQINRGGMKVSPREVDDVLAQHPAVAHVVTFAVPDARLGQEVAACVVVRDGARVTELELMRHAATSLADFKVPRRVVFVQDLPRTQSGKERRVELAAHLGLHQLLPPPAPTASHDDDALPTEIETVVSSMFAAVLGTPVDDLEAAFFDLGGDSLQAMRVCVALEERFGRPMPLAALTTRPSVRAIAALIEGDGYTAEPGAPATLRVGRDDGAMLFVLPGMLGNVFGYHTLVPLLPREHRVVGLPLPGADGLEPALHSMEELAARFLTVVEPELHRRPCALLGYSFGGRVAFEMARQLVARGLPVPTLILFDAPAAGWPAPLRHTHTWRDRLGRARREGARALANRVWRRLVRKATRRAQPVHDAVLAQAVRDDLPAAIRERHQVIGAASRKASAGWQPGSAPVHVHVLRAEESVWEGADAADATLGWRRLATGGVRVWPVSGNHGTLFDPQYVQRLAAQTSAALGTLGRGNGTMTT
jgi:acyl-CoA synthetase (AMP-forming)/AMP-acid ligase II/thioesterase domain-containing protein/acyl carrier protein